MFGNIQFAIKTDTGRWAKEALAAFGTAAIGSHWTEIESESGI